MRPHPAKGWRAHLAPHLVFLIPELIMAAGGSDALEWESERSKGGKAARDWLRTKANSIEGGTSEIQLGIVAKHILRLPGA